MRRILALDLGSSSLKAVIVESLLRGFRLVDFYSTPRQPALELGAQLKAFLALHHLHADTVLSCLPGDVVSHRILSFPFRRTRQLSQTVPFELESYVPFSLEEIVVDFQVLSQSTDGTSVLAVFVPKSVLQEHLAVLAEAGLDPQAVDIASLTALNVLRTAQVDMSGSLAAIDLGATRTTVALLYNGVLCGLRTLSAGVETAGDLAAHLQEIRWTLLALSDSPGPFRLILSGEKELSEALVSEAKPSGSGRRPEFGQVIPLHTLPLRFVPQERREEQGIFAAALGLALREGLDHSAWGVNLRQGEFAYHQETVGVRREVLRLSSLAALVALLASAAFSLDYYRLKTHDTALQQEIHRLFASTLPEVRPIVNAKIQLEHAIAALRHHPRLLGSNISSVPSALECLRLLSSSLPEQVKLDLDEFSLDDEALRLRGTTESFEAAETIRKAAAALFPLRDAQLKDVKTSVDGRKVEFRLILLFAHPFDPAQGRTQEKT